MNSSKLGNVKKIHRFSKYKKIPEVRINKESLNPVLPKINITKESFLNQHKTFKKIAIILGISLLVLPISYVSFQQALHKYNVNAYEETQEINVSEVVINNSPNSQILGLNTYNAQFKSLDKRTYVLDQYFKSRNSPLYGTGADFVSACDRYGAPRDCITLAAIARHETDLCNYYNSAEMFNCLGWGGGGEYRMRFSSFQQMIDTATDVLVNQYGYEYMVDPELMEKTFCGPQDECIGWGDRVKILMRELDNFSESIGMGRLTDLR